MNTNIFKLFSSLVHIRTTQAANDATISESEIRHAIEELHALSDRDLDDLGIARGDIEYAVRYGRQAIDDTIRHAA